MVVDSIRLAIAGLLDEIGQNGKSFRLEPLSTSGNNRVFSANCDGQILTVKLYFHDLDDTRNRLTTEYSFLGHAWQVGLRCVPKPLAKDPANYLALYEFVDGKKIEPEHVNEQLVYQAASFLADLNSLHSRSSGTGLRAASEACFSVTDHFAMVDARLARLHAMPLESDIDQAAHKFVATLTNFWQSTKARLLKACAAIKLNPDASLVQSERCLSPSDFGFHNALIRPDGNLCFIDFEYAGWDDPAKAIGDFFSHPGIAVPHHQFESFLSKVLKPFDGAQLMAERVRLLEPVSHVKWCCIILNEFLPAAARRRNFANPSNDLLARKLNQLNKAKQLFESLHY